MSSGSKARQPSDRNGLKGGGSARTTEEAGQCPWREATVLDVKGIGGHKTCYAVAGVAVAHVVECLSIALRMTSSLRIQAVRASFLVLAGGYKTCVQATE